MLAVSGPQNILFHRVQSISVKYLLKQTFIRGGANILGNGTENLREV